MKQEIDKHLALEIRYNEQYTGACDDARALAAWRLESRQIFGPTPPPKREHEEERRKLNDELLQTLKTLAPDFHSRGIVLGELLKHQARPIIEASPLRLRLFEFHRHTPWAGERPLPLPPDGFFWWAQTQWSYSHHGLQAQFESDGLHFFGSLDYEGDPLVHHHIGATATFELDPSRRPPSSNGRWRSRPWVELYGRIDGWTSLHHWLWAADDKWCKCWLSLRQTALQFVGPNTIILGSNVEVRTLINEENKGRSVHADLPGFQPMPFLEFGLADPNRSVIVDLEVRFEIQLEGSSYIAFSPQPNPFQSVLLRTFQWQVESI